MKKYGKHIAISVLIILIIAAVVISANIFKNGGREKLVSLDRVFESITVDEDAVYVKFENDSASYVVYKVGDVGEQCLFGLNKGDRVSLTVDADYENYVHASIYSMSSAGETLFDLREYYSQRNLAATKIISFPIIAALLTMLAVALFVRSAPEFSDDSFILKSGKIAKSFMYAFVISGCVNIVTVLVMFFTKQIGKELLPIIAFGAFLLIIGGIGIYAIHTERFTLKDGVYSYRAPFKKTVSLTVEEIGRVDVNLKKSPFRVEFFGKDGGKLLRINDSGFVFGKGYFGRSLAHFRIRRRIIVNRMPPLAAVERTLTEQFSAYERSWVSFKYRDVTYLIGYDGGSFFAFAEGESERTEAKEFSDLLSFECKDGVTLDAAWEYTSDFTLIT